MSAWLIAIVGSAAGAVLAAIAITLGPALVRRLRSGAAARAAQRAEQRAAAVAAAEKDRRADCIAAVLARAGELGIAVPVKVTSLGHRCYRMEHSNGTTSDVVHGDIPAYIDLVQRGLYNPIHGPGGPVRSVPVPVHKWTVEQLDDWLANHAT